MEGGSGRACGGFAYLFEKFPAFSQTFCFREVAALRRQTSNFAVYSLRNPGAQPAQNFPPEIEGLTRYLPASFDERLCQDAKFRRRARAAQEDMENLWGDQSEKRRIYEALWLADELQACGIGHVHAHFAGMAARAAFWLNRLEGISYSFTAHANDIFCDEPHERLAMLVEAAEWVATETEFSANFLRREFPAHSARIHRVYNGISLAPLAVREAAVPPLIVAVGRYIEKKGFGDLIAACARIREREFRCHIVGHGPLEAEFRAQVNGAGLSEKVFITGPKTQAEISDLLATATMFVLPCVNASDGGSDNLPTVIMEAMAAGVPVVSTPVAGIPEMVVDQETGFLVAEKDPAALAARMEQLLAEPESAREMGLAGRKLCEQRFEIGRTSAELRKLLEAPRRETGSRRGGWLDRFIARE